MPLGHLLSLSILCIYISVGVTASFSSSLRGVGPPGVAFEHLDPTLPPVLPGQTPKCSVLVLQQDFADTVGSPPASSANYTQPLECPAPWTRVVLELSVSVSGPQKDRIAAVWLDGVEVLRTTTPLPDMPGVFWRVRKDVTRYTATVRRLADTGGSVAMMLENSNAALPGVYSVNISLDFYRGAVPSQAAGFIAHPTIKGLYRDPADLIIPLSNANGYAKDGFWFRINNADDVQTASVAIPANAYRAVIEIFASYHADDALWYVNPLRSAYLQQQSNLSATKANGGFRQVYATIDKKFVGGHIPFAVIYPGAINPFFWSPVAAIGAFDMPSYDLDVTPFLGLLLDGRPHEFGLGVNDAQPYWLLGANLHVWVDAWSDATQAELVEYNAPPVKISRNAEWRNLEGQSEILAEGLLRFIGWVSSSKGNLTTVVRQKIKFKSQVEVQNRGAVTQVEVSNKARATVGVQIGNQPLARAQMLVEAPLQLQTSSVNAVGGTVFQKTRLFHQLLEEVNLSEGQAVGGSSLTDRQEAEGSALLNNGEPVWGSGSTRSSYKYRDGTTCYLRSVDTAGGIVTSDTGSPSCAAVADA